MTPFRIAIFGALAAATTLGAAQLAFGHVLTDERDTVGMALSPATPSPAKASVNRSVKADRLAAPVTTGAPTRTVAMRPLDMAETSVIIRIPAPVEEARRLPSMRGTGPGLKPVKAIVACEPMVSALTEVARLLQPGRCVT
jgi:hypothetical protein